MKKIQKQIGKYLKDIAFGCGYRYPKIYIYGHKYPYGQRYQRSFAVIIEDLELVDFLVLTKAYEKTGVKVTVLSPKDFMAQGYEEVIRII